ncbi:MAG: potassium-transporting ATPase subunit F [Candidatus Obscuribacterales bacterium]|nr:potassium-transporting ATPase subunit F [Candidatus Melainabacteria bacterium]
MSPSELILLLISISLAVYLLVALVKPELFA